MGYHNSKRNLQQYNADTCSPLKEAYRLGEVKLEALARDNYPGFPMSGHMLKGVNTIGYWDAQTQQNWGLDWHRNEGLELTFLETGSLSFAVEGQQVSRMQANGLTITRPWQMHKVGNPNIEVGRLYWVILDVKVKNPHEKWEWPDWIILSQKDLEELTNVLRKNEQPIWSASREICCSFQKIGRSVKQDKTGTCESQLSIVINELLLNILKMFRKGNIFLDDSLTESMRSAELFLSKLPSRLDINWTLKSMAEQCGLGTTYFIHCCKKLTNMTPMQYLNYQRLNAAAENLKKYPEVSISNIAYDFGFTSSQYFATTFKKHYGISPQNFRKNIR